MSPLWLDLKLAPQVAEFRLVLFFWVWVGNSSTHIGIHGVLADVYLRSRWDLVFFAWAYSINTKNWTSLCDTVSTEAAGPLSNRFGFQGQNRKTLSLLKQQLWLRCKVTHYLHCSPATCNCWIMIRVLYMTLWQQFIFKPVLLQEHDGVDPPE